MCRPPQCFAGAAGPMLKAAETATWFHGKDGLGDMNYPAASCGAEGEHAVDAILRLTKKFPGLTWVTLGPLTNVALAILREPGIVKLVERCVVMGGNPCCIGNVTPGAEYNVWCDPEAAEIVMRSGVKVEMVGWHLCRGEACLNPAEIAAVRAIGTEIAHFSVDSNRVAMEANRVQTGEIGIVLPDPTAMAIAIDPGLAVKASEHLVRVDCGSELTRGMTVVDLLNVGLDARNKAVWAGAGKVKVVWEMNVKGFKEMLMKALG